MKTDVFAGVLASAGVAGGAAATHRWCFRDFAVQLSDGTDVPEVWEPPPSNEPGWIPPDPNSSTPPAQPNTCTCANGFAATGPACPADGAAVCVACDSGYSLSVAGGCSPDEYEYEYEYEYDYDYDYSPTPSPPPTPTPTCTCANGVGATGSACPSNGAAVCAACDPGFALTFGVCNPLACVCTDGDAATGAACPAQGAERCVACDPGFALSADGTCR